ncbi:MAG: malate synthase A [Myxococcota bacterium]|nr:malate synthase A [Myxococcota bacterium]
MNLLSSDRPLSRSVDLHAPLRPGYERILTPAALAFVADLANTFTGRVEELLVLRRVVQSRFDAGMLPRFRPETRHIRASDWTCAPLPEDLLDRRVEITGPVDRKMIINGLNSGANVLMADFEDATCPSWGNVVEGQINLFDAVRGTIRYVHPESEKTYELGDDPAVLFVRPRGLHLWEKHVQVAGRAVPAGLFDFGLYFFHNASELLARGSGPYFYLPKLQSRLEARLWNDVFLRAQALLGIEAGTIKATVLIETLPAAFEMDEILWELREHSAGLNCGRWDYIFSYIKTFREHGSRVVPDRSEVGMTQPLMTAYSKLLIKTCHRREVHAMGGMAAQIPIKGDPEANEAALNKVREDKLREVESGHDGTWVAHPALVPIAREVFDAGMPEPNQLGRKLEALVVTESDLVAPPTGGMTEAGLRLNISVGLRYLTAWLEGRGCVPIDHLMEDAATAEISRTQVWQWQRHGALLDDGREVTRELVQRTLAEELIRFREELGEAALRNSRCDAAAELFGLLVSDNHFHDFLTLPAYEEIRENLHPMT